MGRFQPKGDPNEPREPFLPDEMLEKELLVRVVHTKHNYSHKEPEKWLIKQGAFIECFIPEFDLRVTEAQRYGELYLWWAGIFNSPKQIL